MQMFIGIIIGLAIGIIIAILTVLSYGSYIRRRNLKKTYVLTCREYGQSGLLIGEFNKIVTSCLTPYEASEVLMISLSPYIQEGRKFTIINVREMKEYEVL